MALQTNIMLCEWWQASGWHTSTYCLSGFQLQKHETQPFAFHSLEQANYAYIGTTALRITAPEHTMNLQKFTVGTPPNFLLNCTVLTRAACISYRSACNTSVILHEFGHMLGLLHEHQHPDCKIQWNLLPLFAVCSLLYSFVQGGA